LKVESLRLLQAESQSYWWFLRLDGGKPVTKNQQPITSQISNFQLSTTKVVNAIQAFTIDQISNQYFSISNSLQSNQTVFNDGHPQTITKQFFYFRCRP